MHYIELQFVCRPCGTDRPPILGAWAIDSRPDEFDPAQIFARANSSVTLQQVGDSAEASRQRIKMKCPRCGHAPVFRFEKVEEALAALYVQGTVARPVQLPV